MIERDKRRSSKPSVLDDGYRLPDDLWARMEPLLPLRPSDPLGCHNPLTPDCTEMDAILIVLRTGCLCVLAADGDPLSIGPERRS